MGWDACLVGSAAYLERWDGAFSFGGVDGHVHTPIPPTRPPTHPTLHSWNAGKKFMGNVDQFLRSLLTFDKDNVPGGQMGGGILAGAGRWDLWSNLAADSRLPPSVSSIPAMLHPLALWDTA